MTCPKCGATIGEGLAFCTNCGANISVQNNQQNTQQNYQQQYQQPYQQQYQQPYQQQYQQPYKANIQKRELATCIILSIVTCGIYSIFWMINLANDLNTASGRTTDSNGTTVFLLTLVTCGIYGFFWLYQAGEKVAAIKQCNGQLDSSSSVLYLVLSLFGLDIVAYCLIQNELNKVATY